MVLTIREVINKTEWTENLRFLDRPPHTADGLMIPCFRSGTFEHFFPGLLTLISTNQHLELDFENKENNIQEQYLNT